MLFSSILMHFFIIKFHGYLGFLGQSKIGDVAHAEIEGFFVYRARYTRKMPSQSRTYAAVWKTGAYAAAHEVFTYYNGKTCNFLCRMVL